ncbi:MAG TPA: NAD(P)-dependent oxidoreductase [Candidatus Dojkabacteria bacterium]|nr:NAD(P)-dependent oxidoreductase [Candidatus Dojkabacteria bacterium]
MTEAGKEELAQFSQEKIVFFKSDPIDQTEVLTRLKHADAILLSWYHGLPAKTMEKLRNLKYIGICGTNLKNIAVDYAKNKGIVIKNVYDYGDEATAEFVFWQLLNLARGYGKYQWREQPCELFNKTIGIVGMGAVAKQVVRLALGFGMPTFYHSKYRKPEIEAKGVKYLNLQDLIKQSDIVTLHVPKNTMIFSKKEFTLMTKSKILINTCLGKVFEVADLKNWIAKQENYAIIDASTSEEYRQLSTLPNVIYQDLIAGKTFESNERLTKKVLFNIKNFLTGA